ncbi:MULTISPECIES: lycopene cyclase domain-containing protein [unclassified Flammeovirga]|uniref:lycopene cyclase domain-containing protein n=1 Tax=unclassified Flammeovirga TaxID=2637820 RepID=UPI0005C59023|nr:MULTISPECIES: lycopene cyclase domain-containing protein [unclassified Flammeovirga]
MPALSDIYLIINILALMGPLLLSFDKKVAFYKSWIRFIPAFFTMGVIYLPWDIIFTYMMYWGFNPDYLVGVSLFYLPLEEWMFFFIIPYCFLFIYECVIAYFPSTLKKTYLPAYFFIGVAISQAYHGGTYSTTNFYVVCIALVLVYKFLNQAFWWSYLITLFPFLIFNGILTGSFTPEPIVWYNSEVFSNIRVFTIPAEDFIYLLGMMLLCFRGWNMRLYSSDYEQRA